VSTTNPAQPTSITGLRPIRSLSSPNTGTRIVIASSPTTVTPHLRRDLRGARPAARAPGRLTPEQWGSPSLCAGWRVREVVAHMTMPFRTSPLRFVTGLARARFSFDRYADRAARADTAALTDDELVAQLRDNIRHGWRPPGGGEVGALSHDVIHGLDITEPLGLPAPPAERIATVLRGAGPRNFDYFGVRLDGTRLVPPTPTCRSATGARCGCR
jgi:uncharacterized protein (TIGR03083 family)